MYAIYRSKFSCRRFLRRLVFIASILFLCCCRRLDRIDDGPSNLRNINSAFSRRLIGLGSLWNFVSDSNRTFLLLAVVCDDDDDHDDDENISIPRSILVVEPEAQQDEVQ